MMTRRSERAQDSTGVVSEIHHFLRQDPSALSLIVSNLITIVIALIQGWELAVLMWIYWAQSVIIGLANFARILHLQEFSTKGMRVNGRSVKPTPKVKTETAFFFLVHYGFFHLIYFFILAGEARIPEWHFAPVAICVGLFLVNHLFSLIVNLRADLARKPNIGRVMFFPYARIIPLHLTIIFGFFLVRGATGLVFFLIVKTVADLIMHGVEHARPVAVEPTEIASLR
jgi:hypothetical protein